MEISLFFFYLRAIVGWTCDFCFGGNASKMTPHFQYIKCVQILDLKFLRKCWFPSWGLVHPGVMKFLNLLFVVGIKLHANIWIWVNFEGNSLIKVHCLGWYPIMTPVILDEVHPPIFVALSTSQVLLVPRLPWPFQQLLRRAITWRHGPRGISEPTFHRNSLKVHESRLRFFVGLDGLKGLV